MITIDSLIPGVKVAYRQAVTEGAATKGARTRDALLARAIERFATDGFRGTSVSAVARDVGITPAAAYAYFPNKLTLFEAAVDGDTAGLVARAAGPLVGLAPRERMLGLVAGLVAGLEHHPLARRVLAGQEPEVVGRLLELPALVALREENTRVIAAGQQAGRVRTEVEAGVLALGLETVVLALLMAQLQVRDRDDDLTAARRAAVIAVLDGALAPPG
jgi:AcrR family transcriptional regulator